MNSKIHFLILLLFLVFFSGVRINANRNYEIYHQQVIEAEKLIASKNYKEALLIHEKLFSDYDFVFLREYQNATQLAVYVNQRLKAYEYLELGVRAGWELKSIKRNDFLKPLLAGKEWEAIEKNYKNLHEQYQTGLNQKVREQVKKMYSKDQKKAIGALFKLSSKAQDKYAENKFAPHSEEQMDELSDILETHGYPSEKLIGNSYWMSIVLSHHNSISTAYCKKDTIYPELKPRLLEALAKGQISPYELAMIDDWYISVKYERSKPSYGVIEAPSESSVPQSNELRAAIYARPFELREKLMDIEIETGMDFYLSYLWY